MLKKTLTYTDFNGEEQTETIMFHLSKEELIDLELSFDGGLDAEIKKAVDTKDNKGIMRMFTMLLINAYGEKSEDGRYFVKSEDSKHLFKSSAAYQALYFELISDTDSAIAFFKGVIG